MRQPDIQASLDMHLQLRGRIAHGRQRGDGGYLTRTQIEAGSAINVAKRKFDQISRKVGRDVGKRSDDFLSSFAIDLSERASPAFQSAFVGALVVLRHSL